LLDHRLVDEKLNGGLFPLRERAPSLEFVSVPIKRNSFAIKGGFLRFLD
jgi:hypothetical protein